MSDRARAAYFATVILVFLLALAFALRPSPVLGVDGEALSDSINGGPVLGGSEDACRRRDEVWECLIYESSGSSATRYELEVDAWGCWEARPFKRPTGPVAFEGCITLLDH